MHVAEMQQASKISQINLLVRPVEGALPWCAQTLITNVGLAWKITLTPRRIGKKEHIFELSIFTEGTTEKVDVLREA